MLSWMTMCLQQPKVPPVVEMTFPVLGKVVWTDTWGAPRGGGTRPHIGQDLPAEKMRPLVAAIDGIWTGSGITGADGTSVAYYHINNDTPGSDDGKGGDEYAFAPGVWQGVPVKRGQFVAYCGDSGNAEETISHLHFELWLKALGVVNAAPSLSKATHLSESVHYPEHDEFLPNRTDQIRWDGEVREVNPEKNYVKIDLSGTVDLNGQAKGVTSLTRRFLKFDSLEKSPKVGDYIAVVGKVPESGKGMAAKAILVLRSRPAPAVRRRFH